MCLTDRPALTLPTANLEATPATETAKTSSELIEEHNALFESYYIDDSIQRSPPPLAAASIAPKRRQSDHASQDTRDGATAQLSSKKLSETSPTDTGIGSRRSSRISERNNRNSSTDDSVSPLSLDKSTAANTCEPSISAADSSITQEIPKMAGSVPARAFPSISKLEKGKDPAMDLTKKQSSSKGKAPPTISRPVPSLKHPRARDDSLLVTPTKPSQSTKSSNKALVLGPTILSPITARKAGITRTLRANKKYPQKISIASLGLEDESENDDNDDDDDDDNGDDDDDTFHARSFSITSTRKKYNSKVATNSDAAAESTTLGKKQPKSIVPSDYRGIDSNYGSSSNRPAGAKLTTPWRCAHRGCASGMTWWPREGKGSEGMGRKTISHYFGRNKKETNFIHPDVWHTVCRKDYQRLFYRARKSPGGVFPWHMSNLRMQFIRLRLWRPDALFKVQLTSNMRERAGVYHEALVRYNQDATAAKAAYDKHFNDGENRKPNKKGAIRPLNDEEAFPIEHYDEFKKNCCTTDNNLVDYDGIDKVIKYIKLMKRQGKLTQMPPVEFLINEEQEGETVHDPTTNYARWVAASDGETYISPLPVLEAAYDGIGASGKVKPQYDEEEHDGLAIKEEETDEGSDIHVASGKEIKSLLDSVDIEEDTEVDEEIGRESKEEDTKPAIKDLEENASGNDAEDGDDEDEDNHPFAAVDPPRYGGFRPRPGAVRHSSTYGICWGSGNKRKREEAEAVIADTAAPVTGEAEVKRDEETGEEELEFIPIVKRQRTGSIS